MAKTKRTIQSLFIVVGICSLAMSACSGHSGRMAGQGATTGAMAGMVGGLVTGLVFGGNAAEIAAQGAVWGASTGAVSGAMAGARVDRAEQEARQRAELERIRAKLGDDAFNGLAALAQCKHEVSLAYARTAAASDKKNYALAGLWLEIITYGDRGERDLAVQRFPEIIEKDAKISSEAQAFEKLDAALERLKEIRGEFNLPKTCN